MILKKNDPKFPNTINVISPFFDLLLLKPGGGKIGSLETGIRTGRHAAAVKFRKLFSLTIFAGHLHSKGKTTGSPTVKLVGFKLGFISSFGCHT
uniref:Uncharacterized protein n=1 Tax=Helianthus annuus TaxID=4232 RepID=A0A251V3H8_HELAN